MFHTIWPEGLPSKAFYTDSELSAFWYLFKKRFKYLLSFHKARRMRHAQSKEGFPHPIIVENRLRQIGAIPPPNGWPIFSNDPIEHDVATGTVHIKTHSVL